MSHFVSRLLTLLCCGLARPESPPPSSGAPTNPSAGQVHRSKNRHGHHHNRRDRNKAGPPLPAAVKERMTLEGKFGLPAGPRAWIDSEEGRKEGERWREVRGVPRVAPMGGREVVVVEARTKRQEILRAEKRRKEREGG
ncbi:hypothetical protein EDC01DRAFT_776696 [Geopyxis carbonaria]|nr:hypothetical protein EDC01DRAFT_776696 [Geopyxis carbonaria]